MSFIDRDFVWLLPLALACWFLARRHYEVRIGLMLALSLLFYAYGHWWPLIIILMYCVVDWLTGIWLERSARKRLVLACGVAFNVGMLCFWKYTPLVFQTLFGVRQAQAAVLDGWVIPMGISFYSFTGIAYMTDVYRRKIPAERSFWRYALFTSFFPHLVAGPILRAGEFLWHLEPQTLPQRPEAPLEATVLIARGFFKKLILADSIAAAIDPFFAHVGDSTTAGVWSLPFVYLYALQIYFDFSGYTDIARGLGLWFGFRWPDNFNWPYLATSVQEFWRRWHMTLSRFLRDYLYIPFGGNRHGPVRAGVALMATMLLGGLWHGASWSFLIWGGLHGLLLILHRAWTSFPVQRRLASLRGAPGAVWNAFCVALTFNAVCLAWCFFRLTDVRQSLICVTQWFRFDSETMFIGLAENGALWIWLVAYALVVFAVSRMSRTPQISGFCAELRGHPLGRGVIWGAAASLLIISLLLARTGERAPFIYFQF